LPEKSLICWDLVVLSMPAMLAGKILGLMANIIFPEWLIVIIFITVMLNDFIGTLQYYKGTAPQHPCGCSAPNNTNDITKKITCKEHQVIISNETKYLSNDQNANNTQESNKRLDIKDNGAENGELSVKYQNLPKSEKESTKIEINDNYSKFSLTYMKTAILIFTIALNILTTFLRGSNKAESIIGLKQCDTLSWIIFGI